jgi:hypothetical protein
LLLFVAGLAILWSFIALVVWLVFQLFGEGGMGLPCFIPGGLTGVALFFIWLYFRQSASQSRRLRPRRRRLPEEQDDPPYH